MFEETIMNEENDKYAELLELYAKKIRRFKTPLIDEEKQSIRSLGKTIYKRQVPRMVKHKKNKNAKPTINGER